MVELGSEEILREGALVLSPVSRDLDHNFEKSSSSWVSLGFLFSRSVRVLMFKKIIKCWELHVRGAVCNSHWEEELLV